MNPANGKSCVPALLAAALLVAPLLVASQSLSQVLNTEERRTRLVQESQERIDKVVDQTRGLESEYKSVMKVIDGLKVYNTLMQRQVDNQLAEMQDLTKSIEEVDVINRQIVPIMTRMIESLEQFVELDVPFQLKERRNRVANLNELMERQDISVAEKFRKVTEAYQIENDFGRTIESYKDTLNIDGANREVDFLRVGRVVLAYQTADGSVTGAWDQANRQWIVLGSEYKNDIKKGLQIAKKQIAPDLILVPMQAPEAG